MASLTRLMQKGAKFIWTNECKNKFQKLKEFLMIALTLMLPLGTDGYIVTLTHLELDWVAY